MKKVFSFVLFIFCAAFIYLLNLGEERDFEDKFQGNNSIQVEDNDIVETEKIVLNTYNFDLNKDNILDKINLFQNDETEDAFDRKYFNLPIEILKGNKNGFIKWKESNDVIFKPQNTCVSEGFYSISFKDDYFMIEQQGCYDYNISVWSTLTFEIFNDEILLHKYHETYFNKADHKQKIPSKIWTKVDFGDVRFEDVSENFIIQLRNEN